MPAKTRPLDEEPDSDTAVTSQVWVITNQERTRFFKATGDPTVPTTYKADLLDASHFNSESAAEFALEIWWSAECQAFGLNQVALFKITTIVEEVQDNSRNERQTHAI